MHKFNGPSFVMGFCVGTFIAIFALIYAYTNDLVAHADKWQRKMVDCGCGAYDEKTGAWYAIEMAPAPEPAPYFPENESKNWKSDNSMFEPKTEPKATPKETVPDGWYGSME